MNGLIGSVYKLASVTKFGQKKVEWLLTGRIFKDTK